ncbi:MAG TPA: type II toxin-antitoxin system RelE/ParE family toxin [Burkholderiaceae bacterium]|nr:type II toxin-antitoxin system RelE/ParE family toxin [Burkholderiaceae bacterium]
MPASAGAYRLTRRAESDLEEIWLYSCKRWSAQQANRYHRLISQVIEVLSQGARKGVAIDDIRPGYLRHPVGVHVIFFRRQGDSITVVRVLHERT